MGEKIMFNIGVDIDGQLSVSKLNRIQETIESALVAVGMPQEELRKEDREVPTYKTWHVHKPEEDACQKCIQTATKDVVRDAQ